MHCSWAGPTGSLPFATLHDCLSDMYSVTSRCKQLALLLQNSLTVQRLEGILMGFIFRVFFCYEFSFFFVFLFFSLSPKRQNTVIVDQKMYWVRFLILRSLPCDSYVERQGFVLWPVQELSWCTFRKKTAIDTHTQPTEVQSCMWNQLTSLKNIWKHCPVAAVAIMSLPFFPC